MSQTTDFEKKIKELTAKIALKPENADNYLERGRLCYKEGFYNEALKDFNKVLELNPENKKVKAYIELCSTKVNQVIKAEDYSEEYKNNIDENSFSDPLDEVSELFEFLHRVFFYLQRGENDNGIKYLNKIVEFRPKDIRIYIFRGIFYSRSRKYKEAEEDFNKIVELKPNEIRSYFIRGLYYHVVQKQEKAINDLNKIIELDPEKMESYLMRGIYYHLIGKHEDALNDFDKIAKVNPEKVFIRGGYRHLIQQYEEAEKDFSKNIDLKPIDPLGYFFRGFHYHLIQKNEEAMSDFKKFSEFSESYRVSDIFTLCFKYIFLPFIQSVTEIKKKNEQEKLELKTNIFQAVSHTISNIMVANKSITKRIKNGTNSMNDVNRLELLNDLVLSTMNAVKLVFSNEDIVLSQARDELFSEKIKDGISLHNLLWFCLNINLYYLVVGEGEEAWATIRNIFFSIDISDKKKVKEKLNMLEAMPKETRNLPLFSISDLSEDQISGFVNAFQSEQFEAVHQFFVIQIENLRNLYVKKDSYTFSVLFIILLELTKNMLRHGTIEDQSVRKFTMKSETDGDYVILTLANVCQKSRLKLKESTLKGLSMIQEFSKAVGKFEQSKKYIEISEFFEFEAKLFIKKPEHQEMVKDEGI